ncbi:DEKNAAC104759 [Brettanomyces naardenensis]|uniref:DEKNAAC104759 n=1 Tax=Brettanomyces naardenensis TaxID=13370 RepID=A0A448YQZ7_BRENA|nr:DEKNAAC104759 [Brettanomyces naardenensis]
MMNSRNVYKVINRSRGIGSFLQRRFLTLQAVQTPNENALKFIARDAKFLPEDLASAVEIDSLAEADERSPIATELFKISGVRSIMVGPDFITVNKIDKSLSNNDELDWNTLSPKVVDTITKATRAGIPAITESFKHDLQQELDEAQDDDDDVVYEIKEVISTRIKPALQDDGGDIHFRSFDESTGTVFIKLKGACKSCSLSEDTLKNGIESMLMHYIPEVRTVKSVLDPEEEIALQEFEKMERRLKAKAP